MKIGFFINPIAGMGGTVGLKGTDGVYEEALKRGAKKIAIDRAKRFLKNLNIDAEFLVPSKEMGEKVLKDTNLRYKVVYETKDTTTAEDTKNFIKKILNDVEIIVFVGGDGTARDVAEVVKDKPVIGVPSGVKMYSPVFGVTPEASQELLKLFIEGNAEITDKEVLDIDEKAYRKNKLRIKIYGYVKGVTKKGFSQLGKILIEESEETSKRGIADFISEIMRDDTLYILCPGTTVKAIAEKIGVEKTLLGVDVTLGKRVIAKDVDEKKLLELLEKYQKAKIIVSPLGKQGFVFGRGNQQISAEVIKKVGVENIIIVATDGKLRETSNLYVDTNDPELDKKLCGEKLVVCGYAIAQRRKILSQK